MYVSYAEIVLRKENENYMSEVAEAARMALGKEVKITCAEV